MLNSCALQLCCPHIDLSAPCRERERERENERKRELITPRRERDRQRDREKKRKRTNLNIRSQRRSKTGSCEPWMLSSKAVELD